MNIFFLSLDPNECARLYCDQHVIKILLEVVQMLYTAWNLSGLEYRAPYNRARTRRGYRSAHVNHPMCMWVRANYGFAARLAVALAVEYTNRFHKVHACAKHALWLFDHRPPPATVTYRPTTYLSREGIPECMPEEHWNPDIVEAYRSYYTTKTFARWTTSS